jgi:hypothetical protein
MRSCKRSMLVTVAALAVGFLATPWPATALTLIIRDDSGPNIKRELFRTDGNFTDIWDSAQFLSFSFPVPFTASGDGLFRMFAGGDLNNLSSDRIDVSTGPFGSRTSLGTFAFPIGDAHFTGCEAPHDDGNPSPCPVPETVPGGRHRNPARGPAVGEVEGRRNTTTSSAGTRGLVVPQSLLVGGTTLTVDLSPSNAIYDLYIDRLEVSYRFGSPVPEPETWLLLAVGLVALLPRVIRRHRLNGLASPR